MLAAAISGNGANRDECYFPASFDDIAALWGYKKVFY